MKLWPCWHNWHETHVKPCTIKKIRLDLDANNRNASNAQRAYMPDNHMFNMFFGDQQLVTCTILLSFTCFVFKMSCSQFLSTAGALWKGAGGQRGMPTPTRARLFDARIKRSADGAAEGWPCPLKRCGSLSKRSSKLLVRTICSMVAVVLHDWQIVSRTNSAELRHDASIQYQYALCHPLHI